MMLSAFSIHIAVNVYMFAASSVLIKKIDYTAVAMYTQKCNVSTESSWKLPTNCIFSKSAKVNYFRSGLESLSIREQVS